MTDLSDNSIYLPAPNQRCDIVMKGGITSGVVYPRALCEIAQKYRFMDIGGTSAGAMAAAAAAAAEYGRDKPTGGFARLAKVPDEVGADLLGLFQPAPELKPLFNIFLALLKGGNALTRTLRILWAAFIGYLPIAAIGVVIGFGLAAALVYFSHADPRALPFIGLGFATATTVLVLAIRVYKALTQELPKTAFDFGLCSGKTMSGYKRAAFTDWLNGLVNELAGRTAADAPLTFGELSAHSNDPITLKMMTTSLMERRPYSLPMANGGGFLFEKSEWARLFPDNVMTHLLKDNPRVTPAEGEEGEFYALPDAGNLPIVVAARMSLSFPLLISAVPLWRRDKSYRTEHDMQRLRRCLFSDGGLSSNFPIHFFDGLLPSRPTFAIALEDYNRDKNYRLVPDRDLKEDPPKYWMSDLSETAPRLPVQDFSGLLGFLLRLVDSAKDWQDNLQSLLPGYRERIAYVGLEGHEGGLNVTMSEGEVTGLSDRGQKAAQELVAEFANEAQSARWEEHRWRRYLVAQARLEDALSTVAGRLSETGDGSWTEFLSTSGYASKPQFYPLDADLLKALKERGLKLSELCGPWAKPPNLAGIKSNLPQPDTDLRVTPKP